MKYLVAVAIMTALFCSKKVVQSTPVFVPLPEPIASIPDTAGPIMEELIYDTPGPRSTFIYFDFDSDEIPDSEKIKLIQIDRCKLVIGKTCDIGDSSYNYLLGARRAKAVRDELYHKSIYVDSVVSIGESHPMLSDKKLNRCCEIIY